MKTAYDHQLEAITAAQTAKTGIFHLPTGSGKTFIEASIIADDIVTRQNAGLPPTIYMVNTPRIVLSCQVMSEVRDHLINQNNVQAKYFALHSGSVSMGETAKERRERLKEEKAALNAMPMDISKGTSANSIVEAYTEAKRAGVPLIIGATYHSATRVTARACADMKIEIMLNDEAHYLVSNTFMQLVHGDKKINAEHVYHFTATLRKTKSVNGIGMGNADVFGSVIYAASAARLVVDGILARVRMHIVSNETTFDTDGSDVDSVHVKQAFIEHVQQCRGLGAKMLVAARDGSIELDKLVQSVELQELREVYPQLTVFDLTTKFGARKNGVPYPGSKVKAKSAMMKAIRDLKDADQAIIIHCDMLAEGIDVPGITGVMPLRSLQLDKLLQTIGRALRVHPRDRAKLRSGALSSSDPDRYLKPYAWVIIPAYGNESDDRRAEIEETVELLRQFDFNPYIDVYVSSNHGEAPKPLEKVKGADSNETPAAILVGEVLQVIEDKERADMISDIVSSAPRFTSDGIGAMD